MVKLCQYVAPPNFPMGDQMDADAENRVGMGGVRRFKEMI